VHLGGHRDGAPMSDALTKIRSWATEMDERTAAQVANTAAMPFVRGVRLMPDAHLGLGSTVGSVIATEGAIMPAAVGVDIGCGMIASRLNLTAGDLPENLDGLLARIEAVIPAGLGRQFGDVDPSTFQWWEPYEGSSWPVTPLNEKQEKTAIAQFGTLGSGNHFVEVCLDEDDGVWIVLHSGSRGVGNQLARVHIEGAKGLMKRYFIDLPDPDLAYFVQGTPEFDHYIADMLWAQRYALASRAQMMDAALLALGAEIHNPVIGAQRINTHHNFTAMENVWGDRNLWVTRKGAVRAREGDWCVIPGSMATGTYIGRGLGNKASYQSCSHGAGRKMSRTQARKTLTAESLTERMGDRAWNAVSAEALVDEHPDSYKDIDSVMAAQADLVEPVFHLRSVLNYKGTDEGRSRR
jgi:tRNA-splicing ligase RtcB